jgi:molybdenum cofactor cytidylyltransferase
MGSPKALVSFRGTTFLERLLATVEANRIRKIPEEGPGLRRDIGWTRVVLGAHVNEITSQLALDPANIVVNPDWKQGQLSSIQAAIRSLPQDQTDGILLFLVDHPLVRAATVGEIIARFYETGRPIVLPKLRGKRGHPVIFARRLYDELLNAPADQGARAVVWAHAEEVLEVPSEDEGVALNLNDPESLRRALEQF